MVAVSPSDADDAESCLSRRVTAGLLARKASVPTGTSAAELGVTVGAARPTVFGRSLMKVEQVDTSPMCSEILFGEVDRRTAGRLWNFNTTSPQTR